MVGYTDESLENMVLALANGMGVALTEAQVRAAIMRDQEAQLRGIANAPTDRWKNAVQTLAKKELWRK